MRYLKKFNDLKLSKRLLITMLIIGLVPLTMVSLIDLISARNSILSAQYSILNVVRASKAQQLESYYAEVGKQISLLSKSQSIVTAMQKFSTSMNSLSTELDLDRDSYRSYQKSVKNYYATSFNDSYVARNGASIATEKLLPLSKNSVIAQALYISNNRFSLGNKDKLDRAENKSSYSRVHKKLHPELRRLIKNYNYHDLFLIEPINGDIVYSVFKEVDFSTSLKNGPYKNSNLADVFNKARKLKKNMHSVLVDFSEYLPSYMAPASFIASPIYSEHQLIGILVIQLPVSLVNNIMQDGAGLGKTGETYLIGEDRLMRSQSRFIESASVLKLAVNTVASNALLEVKSGQATLTSYRGNEVLSSYSRLNIKGLNWGIIAEIDRDEALTAVTSAIYLNLLISLISIILVSVTALLIASSISTPIAESVAIAEKIAAGHLNNKILATTQCEIGDLQRALASMQKNLNIRIKADQKALADNTRIKQALDNISSKMLVVDVEQNVFYANDAMSEFFVVAEAQFKLNNADFSARSIKHLNLQQILPNAEGQIKALTSGDQEAKVVIQVGDLELLLLANPVLNSEGQRLGTVLEWLDRTLELATEKEMQFVVDKALAGDLSERISMSDKSGFFASLSAGVNQLVSVTEKVTSDTLRVMTAMANGHLNEKIEGVYFGDFEKLKINVNATSDKLTDVVTQIQEAANSVKSGTAEIALANLDLNKRTEEQAASLQQTVVSMGEINQQLQSNADFSIKARDVVNQTRQFAVKGGEVVELTLQAMIGISQSSKKISEVISVIDSISFQIKLLALNAAVEAARVGEVGRGFSVVASEVRNLAGLSANSAKEIAASIKDSRDKVKQGMRLAHESGEMLSEIVSSVSQASEYVEEIASLSREQSCSVAEINESIKHIDELTMQNASMVEEASNASYHLGDQAQKLEKMTSFFTVKSRQFEQR